MSIDANEREGVEAVNRLAKAISNMSPVGAIASGGAVGVAWGEVFKRHWLPEWLHFPSIMALAVALLAFCIHGLFQLRRMKRELDEMMKKMERVNGH
jgi:hypothetical protein